MRTWFHAMGLLAYAGVALAQSPPVVRSDAGMGRPREQWRPDDSDPEMQSYFESIMALGPCNRGPGKECDYPRRLFEQGGDRLAAYLIRQYELARKGDYPGWPAVVQYAAYTRSDTALTYLRQELLRDPQELAHTRYLSSLSALTGSRDPRGIELALTVLERQGEPIIRRRAVVALSGIMVSSRVTESRAIDALMRMEAVGSGEELEVRKASFNALNRLEAAGLLGPRERPADLNEDWERREKAQKAREKARWEQILEIRRRADRAGKAIEANRGDEGSTGDVPEPVDLRR